MYKAKEDGRDGYKFYSADMTEHAFERVMIENSLRTAIKKNQFEVYYQPQIDLKTNKVVCLEALVRWIHPDAGLISPAKFIPIAEESGLITSIDRIVMKKAMKQISSWYAQGYNPGKISLNLATKQLLEDDFINEVEKNLETFRFKSQWLEFEITESDIMKDPQKSIKKLENINDMGIDLAIDDFGTGYSSLAYLKKFPLKKLKIDRSFVMDLEKDKDDAQIVKAIIALGTNLNMSLLAEGVETKAQLDFLNENGCDIIQGFYFAKPMNASEFEEKFLKSN